MIVHDVEQGTPEWLALRLGIPTASEFDKIITPSGKLSASARGYMARLAAERLLNELLGQDLESIEHVRRGKELEPAAVRMFEFETGIASRPVGFITSDDGRWGASPDRLLSDCTGVLEIKCPAPQTHMLYALDGFGPAYRVQVQGQIMVAEAERGIRYSYHQRCPPVTTHTPRDEPFIKTMRSLMTQFSDELDAFVEKQRREGAFAESKHVGNLANAAYGDPFDMDRMAASYGPNTIMAGE